MQIVIPSLSPAISSLADVTSLTLLSEGKEIPVPVNEIVAWFHGQKVTPPTLADLTKDRQVLGIAEYLNLPFVDEKNKHIEVDLTAQKVYAYEGEQKVLEFDISSGRWAPTPTGEFHIWAKVKSQLMHGGDKRFGTYYYLPNVPYVMFFANYEVPKMAGFSLHGTYWHDNFGHPMSHGCVNMKISDAKILYDWAMPPVTNPRSWSTLASSNNPGTAVVIYGETPKE